MAVVLEEEAISVRPATRGACEILGLYSLHIANEGEFIAVVSPEYADAALEALKGCWEARRPAGWGKFGRLRRECAVQLAVRAALGSWTCSWAILCPRIC